MRLTFATFLIGLLAFSAVGNAQPSTTRHGLAIAVGAGPGSADIHCFDCTMPRASSASGFARLGYAVRPTLILDAQARRWSRSTDQTDDDYDFLLLGVQFYPRRTGKSFHFEVGVGYADLSFKSPGSPDTLRLKTAAVSGGLGYDVGIGRSLFLTPYVNAISTSADQPKFNNATINANHPTMRVTVVQAGVAIGWQRFARRRYIPAGERGR